MSVQHIQNSVSGIIAFLKENPKEALSTSPPVTAVMEEGLQCRATGDRGQFIVTDMPEAVGGGGSAPSPGWILRAALATCDATRIALRAAELGIALDRLEVTTRTIDDDRGLFGLDGSVRAGPLSIRTRVTIVAADVSEKVLREIVDYAVTHSPVADSCRGETPSTLEVTIG